MSNPSETTLADNPPRAAGILRNPSQAHTTFQQSQHQQETVISGLNNEKQEVDEDDDEEGEDSEQGTYEDAIGGRWGEGPSHVNVIGAEKSFKKLERQLTQRSSLYRVASGDKGPDDGFGGDFDLTDYLSNMMPRAQEAGIKRRNLGIVWENLEVLGEGVGAQYISTFADPFYWSFQLDQPLLLGKEDIF